MLVAHRLELGQYLRSHRGCAPDGRDLDDGTSVDQVSRPRRGQRGRDPIALERGPADQAGVLELAEGFPDRSRRHAELSRQALDGKGLAGVNLTVQQHLQDRVVDAVSERPALDDRAAVGICASCTPAAGSAANVMIGRFHPRHRACRHTKRSYSVYEVQLGKRLRDRL